MKSERHSTWRYETETLLMEISYLGEAGQLVKRLSQDHPSIRDWDYYRYDVLRGHSSRDTRIALERMLIRFLASFLSNRKDIETLDISPEYTLANDKVDT